jgi:hypothetical protein
MYWNELISRSRATPIVFLEKHKGIYAAFVSLVFVVSLGLSFSSLGLGFYALVGLVVIITICTFLKNTLPFSRVLNDTSSLQALYPFL